MYSKRVFLHDWLQPTFELLHLVFSLVFTLLPFLYQAAVFTLWLRAVHISPTHHFLQRSQRCTDTTPVTVEVHISRKKTMKVMSYKVEGKWKGPFHGWRMWLACRWFTCSAPSYPVNCKLHCFCLAPPQEQTCIFPPERSPAWISHPKKLQKP